MNDTLQLLEQRLAKAYADQASHYGNALRTLERQQVIAKQTVMEENWVFELQRSLDEVSAIDVAMKEDKQAWQQSGRSPSILLSSILDKLAQQIRTLGDLIDERIAVLNKKRLQMMPEVDGIIQQRRILNAYHHTRNDPAPRS